MGYYDRNSLSMDYRQYMEKQTKSISTDIKQSTDRVEGSMVRMQTGIQTAINAQTTAIVASNDALSQTFQDGFNRTNRTIDMGFSGINDQLGYMSTAFSIGFDRISDSIKHMSYEICDKLYAIQNVVSNPLLTQSQELYRRAIDNYNKGFFEEALEDIQASVEKNKTDYVSWFLMGKILAFGAGEFGNVIDLEKAINAFTQSAKYNSPYIAESKEARLLAAEIYFYLGASLYSQSNELLRTEKKSESIEMLDKALKSFEHSFQYSNKMLESLFNVARCKVLQNQKEPALGDLKKLVLLDRNYCLKVLSEYDFSNVSEEFITLINGLKHNFFVNEAEVNYKRVVSLNAELEKLGGVYKNRNKIPERFTEELPYFDIMDYNVEFRDIISQIETAIQTQKTEIQTEIQTQKTATQTAIRMQKLQECREKTKKYDGCIFYDIMNWKRVTFALKNDGTVVLAGSIEDYRDVCSWRNIIAISDGYGLKADGTVVFPKYFRKDTFRRKRIWSAISDWQDIVAISDGITHTIGLKADGTVVTVGSNDEGQCNVSAWRDIVAISVGVLHTVGLKADGTVVAVGNNDKGQCNVSDWRDIVAIYADSYYYVNSNNTTVEATTVGLKADGTVVAVGNNDKGQCNVSDWRDIVAIYAEAKRTIGLKADGTVVADCAWTDYEQQRRNISDWQDIVAISAGMFPTVGLKADGTVVADCGIWTDDKGQLLSRNVSAWRDIVAIYARGDSIFGLKADGTVVADCHKENACDYKGHCNVSDWRDIGPVDKEQIKEQMRRKNQGLCIYCGRKLSGIFTKKCKICDKPN